MSPARTTARYLIGAVAMAVVIAAGTVVRIAVLAHAGAPERADVIIVLGAAQYDGRPSPVFTARLDHAAQLYESGVAGHIITVGAGQPGDRTTEAAAGAEYLAEDGIPDDAILAVERGRDTLTSVRAAAKRAQRHGWTSAILVSDPWHVSRAQMIAADAGLDADVSPVTQGPATADSVEIRYVWRELLGSLYYRLVGGSSGAGTAVL